NLRPEESRAYLRARGLPAARHDEALAFTHGHPLALALVADVQSQEGAAVPFRPQDRPDVVRALLERFVQQAPGPRHREALEVCAHARVTTEGLLAEALGAGGAGELFAWLRGLSFVEEGPEGVFPHDLAREVLEADLRWRNPEAFSDLHRRVRGAVVRRLQETGGRAQQRAGVDLMHLHRANPLMRRLRVFDRETLGTGYALPATEPDRSPILDCVRRHEGDESARVAAYWWGRQPGAFLAFRDGGGQLIGFHATVSLRDATPEDVAADPAVRPALDYARRYGPPRAGEELLLHRFWMGCSTYQALGPALNLNAITCSRLWITTPRLSWSFAVIADPELWQETFTYLRLRRAPEAEFAAGGRPYGVFAHDWRAEPPAAWLEEMGQHEIATDLTLDDLRPPPPPLVVLSQPEFAAAVRQALRDYTHPAVLAASPLLRSRLTADPGPGAPPAALLRLLRQAVEALRGTPRDEKLYRALQRTYLQPAATQELAAEALGLPFSTYRYHLARGIDRVTQSLWRRELEGPEG
ncbi:MAG TPA: ATP-binding protein, partial [Chloroflexota bacterium]|nr:ATP-binding protein [Chloroflexota bacterium]